MPRQPRIEFGDHVYHVINRANARAKIFETDKDYLLFEELLEEANGVRPHINICPPVKTKLQPYSSIFLCMFRRNKEIKIDYWELLKLVFLVVGVIGILGGAIMPDMGAVFLWYGVTVAFGGVLGIFWLLYPIKTIIESSLIVRRPTNYPVLFGVIALFFVIFFIFGFSSFQVLNQPVVWAGYSIGSCVVGCFVYFFCKDMKEKHIGNGVRPVKNQKTMV